MKFLKKIVLLVVMLHATKIFSQQKNETKKITISCIVIDKVTKTPLEYATLVMINVNTRKQVAGGIANQNGEITIEVDQGNYDIEIDSIGYNAILIKNKEIAKKTDLGKISLEKEKMTTTEYNFGKYIETGG